ncbi:hypothetical protein SANA_06070 [Gottschalkiaceae bacterium SANA]|nr:hypothetical protein SANA_06070 [Gottschalkiaceae bacterium SANA]
MKKKLLLVLLGIVLLIALAVAFVPQVRIIGLVVYHNVFVSSTKFEVAGNDLYMDGYICSKTSAQLKKIIEENPQVTRIVMKEVTGSLDDETNLEMSIWVHEKGLDTHLLKDSDIESGGVDFFESGINRTMENGAKIGVHSWASVGANSEEVLPKDLPKDDPEHKKYVDYTIRMLGSDEFYWYTIKAAPAEGMYMMTNDEIEHFGLVTQPIIMD